MSYIKRKRSESFMRSLIVSISNQHINYTPHSSEVFFKDSESVQYLKGRANEVFSKDDAASWNGMLDMFLRHCI